VHVASPETSLNESELLDLMSNLNFPYDMCLIMDNIVFHKSSIERKCAHFRICSGPGTCLGDRLEEVLDRRTRHSVRIQRKTALGALRSRQPHVPSDEARCRATLGGARSRRRSSASLGALDRSHLSPLESAHGDRLHSRRNR